MSLVNPNWLVWLTQSYDIASVTSANVATILFQEYPALERCVVQPR